VERGALSSPDVWDALFSDFYLRAFADDAHAEETAAQALAAARLAGCPDGGDLLDVPCGFGRHAVPLARAGYKVVGVDRSQALIEEARRRSGGGRWPKLVRADYRDLPQADESFDAALNLFSSLGYFGDDEDTRALAEIRRVLRPGGRLLVLEFSKVAKPLEKFYDWYSFKALPRIGKLVAGDADSYRYLAESIRMHPDQAALKALMEQAGLSEVEVFNLSAGVVAIHRGYRI